MTNEQNDALVTAINNLVAALRIVNGNIVELDKNIRGMKELINCGIDKVDSVLRVVWRTEDFLKSLKPGFNAILDLVGENNELLRGECAARDRVEKKRKADRERYHAKKQGEDFARNVITEKEKKREKESSPHTPYKEKREDKVKEPLHACAREENLISTDGSAEKVDEGAENAKNPDLETPKKKRGKKPFKKPTEEEVASYVKARGFHFDAHTFWSFYESKGWMVGSNKMTKWRSACEAFEARKNRKPTGTPRTKPKREVPGVVIHEEESTLRKMGGLF